MLVDDGFATFPKFVVVHFIWAIKTKKKQKLYKVAQKLTYCFCVWKSDIRETVGYKPSLIEGSTENIFSTGNCCTTKTLDHFGKIRHL